MSTIDIIPIRESDGRQAVSGRDLHAFLGLGRDYATWFKVMVEYGFIEGQDFTPIRGESTGGRPSTDHALTLDMAKELAMIQRTDRGKQARQYFIEVEKRALRAPALPQTYAEALRELADRAEQNAALEAKVQEDAPKVLFADSVSASDAPMLVGEVAKVLKGHGVEVGATRFFEWLRRDGYLIRRRGTDWNMPTQRAMELGLFKVKETAVTHSDGRVTLSKTPKVTGRGQVYFINRYGAVAA